MKKILIILSMLFCTAVFAEQITINWLNEDKTVSSTSTCTVGGDVVLPNNIPQKRGYTFKGYVDNYTPVEYIEGTGSQWIDTGYSGKISGIKTKIYISKVADSYGVFGDKTRYTNLIFRILNKNASICAGDKCTTITELHNGDFVKIDWVGNALYLSINNYEYNISMSFVNSTIVLFQAHSFKIAPMKLYYFQIYNNDVLVRDFIPVVDSRGVACLYDKVEHKFYYNAGSGEFIAGPEIQ